MKPNFCKAFFSDKLIATITAALNEHNQELINAINYCTKPAGKYLRPQLVYATGQMFEINTNKLLPIALAIEMIHLYSLIHDDLPCMDNDDYRRGKLSCHKAYNESTAILAGNSLQAMACEIVAAATALTSEQKVSIILEITRASGPKGLMNGQYLDLNLPTYNKDILFSLKTGSLFTAAIMSPLHLAQDSIKATTHSQLLKFANTIGTAYQWYDDSIDNNCQISKDKAAKLKQLALKLINHLPNNQQLKQCIELILPIKTPSLV
jgi:farnesyl diphosphate synthase